MKKWIWMKMWHLVKICRAEKKLVKWKSWYRIQTIGSMNEFPTSSKIDLGYKYEE